MWYKAWSVDIAEASCGGGGPTAVVLLIDSASRWIAVGWVLAAAAVTAQGRTAVKLDFTSSLPSTYVWISSLYFCLNPCSYIVSVYTLNSDFYDWCCVHAFVLSFLTGWQLWYVNNVLIWWWDFVDTQILIQLQESGWVLTIQPNLNPPKVGGFYLIGWFSVFIILHS